MRAAVLLLALALAGPVAAQDVVVTGTLRTVLDRGSLRLGVRESAVPFSFLNRAGQPVGFSVDLCMGVAADVAAALNLVLPDASGTGAEAGRVLRVELVPVTPEQRLPKVIAGEIDLECGSTTATTERAKTVAFSPVFFLAGTRLLVPANSGIGGYRDLAGRGVAVSAGTTNGDAMRALARRGTPAFSVTQAPDVPAAIALVADGKAAAAASDDVLLAGLMATRPDAGRFVLVGDYLSYEPYALVYRKDDPGFAGLVEASFRRMAADGTLRGRYNRWFTDRLPNGETLNLPMSAHLAEMFRALGEPD